MTESNGLLLVCPVCKKECVGRQGLSSHLVFHPYAKPFKCSCGKCFSQAWDLHHHIHHEAQKFALMITVGIGIVVTSIYCDTMIHHHNAVHRIHRIMITCNTDDVSFSGNYKFSVILYRVNNH